MKYLYTTIFLLCSINLFSQKLYWVGGASNNWNNPVNWSTTSGGTGGAGVPGVANYAVFDSNADVNFDAGASTSILGIHVLNGANVKLMPSITTTLNVTSTATDIANIAFYIAPNSALIDSAVNGAASYFTLTYKLNSRGIIDGTFALTGVPGSSGTPVDMGKSRIQTENGALITVRSGGVWRQGNPTAATSLGTNYSRLVFENGSTYMVNISYAGVIGPATFASNSTTYLYGNVVNAFPTFNTSNTNYGNIIVDLQNISSSINVKSIPFVNGMTIHGDLIIRNTAGEELVLASTTSSSFSLNISNNFIIEPNALVVLGNTNTDHEAVYTIGKNLQMSGGILMFRREPLTPDAYSVPVVMKVLGNIQQTGGTITTGNVSVSSLADELFVIEMAGTTNQTINAAGNWDNILQNIVLRINNPNGVTLNSPVAVSKISWNSTNKGLINTSSANPLTILNPSTTDATVMNEVGNTGYVNGPVRRMTSAMESYSFPTGHNGVYRPVSVLPQTGTSSTYEAQYWNQAFSNLTVNPLLNGISTQEYWRVARVSGSTPASVQLTLNGAVPGALSNDGLVVASYNGSQWNSEFLGSSSNMIIPGNSTSGVVQTEFISPNRFYTFGFGTATTLPIHLTDFNVRKLNSQEALVQWNVTAESTPVSFVIERSTNGVQFNAIGTVNANGATAYQFTDTRIPNGKLYYRLQMLDQDGTITYSDIQSILNSNNDSKLQVFPTITNAQTQLKVEVARTSKVTMMVSDNSGKVLIRSAHVLNAGTQFLPVNASSLANGVYYVVLVYEDGIQSAPQRFVKQ